MVSLNTPVCEFGKPAIDFALPGVDGGIWTLDRCRGPAGLLVMFICNHCPFVQAALERIVRDCRELESLGVNSVAIMPNDIVAYSQDGPEHMARLALEAGFNFPYLLDATQTVARAYGAVCTPDFFGYDAGLRLRYRGRLDGATPGRVVPDAPRELFEALRQVADTGLAPVPQLPSVGCSIKWRA